MKNHTISLTLTTPQIAYLENALHDSRNSITDALESSKFEFERPQLENQCDVLDILIGTIENTISGVNHA